MIIIEFKGGLGNQMFQYTFGRFLSEQLSMEIAWDTSFYENQTKRNFELSNFNIYGNAIDKKSYQKKNFVKRKIVEFENYLYGRNVIINESKNIDENKFKLKENYYLRGYWQDVKYFQAIREDIINELSLKNIPSTIGEIHNKIKESNSISIHIRKGDYVTESKNLEIYSNINSDYYIESIKNMETKIENPKYFVFTDDKHQAMHILRNIEAKIEFIDNNNALESFHLMSLCKNNIIANSTFSWWASCLNKNANKKIIMPKNWFISELNAKKVESLTYENILLL